MRTSESNAQLMRLFRRLRSYFAVVAVPRETGRSPRVSLSRNNGGSFRRLFEAAQSTDRTQRYRKPLRARYARMIALVVELLIHIDGCFNSPQPIQFLFPAFRCLSRGLFSLRRSGPRNGQNSRRRDSTVLERPARSPCGCTTAAPLIHTAQRPPRDSSQITFRQHSVRCRTRVHRLAAVYLRVRRSRTSQPSSRGHRAVDRRDASSVKVASRVACSVASQRWTLARTQTRVVQVFVAIRRSRQKREINVGSRQDRIRSSGFYTEEDGPTWTIKTSYRKRN